MKKNWKYAAAAVLIPFVAILALSLAMCVITSLAAPTKLDGQTRAVPAVMTKVTRDWRYEYPCGIIASILRRCNETAAFVAELRTLDGKSEQIMFFKVPSDGPHPMVGDSGVWVLHRDALFPYMTCAQRSALTAGGCLAEMWWTLESDDDMRF